jgi:DnaJ-class molecular chaperone
MSESFYKILEVDEKATKEEIKKSFRRLSMKWHPDKNPGNPNSVAMFQKISEAYEVLGNEEKRQEYDMMNKNPFSRMNSFSPNMEENMDEFLNAMFGNIPFFQGTHLGGQIPSFLGVPGTSKIHVFHGGPMGFQQSFQKPTPIIKNIIINIEQVLIDSKIPIDIQRWIMENNNKIFETETIYVDIPQGVDDNEMFIIRDKGNIINEYCKGDLKIFVKIINNTEFKRLGLDLILEKEISLKHALCGFSFELKHLNGKSYTVNNNSSNIIEPEHKKIVSGLGLKRETHVGNLIIHFHVKFPETLSEEQKIQIKNIL